MDETAIPLRQLLHGNAHIICCTNVRRMGCVRILNFLLKHILNFYFIQAYLDKQTYQISFSDYSLWINLQVAHKDRAAFYKSSIVTWAFSDLRIFKRKSIQWKYSNPWNVLLFNLFQQHTAGFNGFNLPRRRTTAMVSSWNVYILYRVLCCVPLFLR